MRILTILLLLSTLVPPIRAGEKEKARLDATTLMFSDVMKISEQAIPQELLDRAECVALIPGVKKGAFIFGGEFGRGYAICRTKQDIGWTAPASLRVEGGSFGLQFGGQETDVILLIMNELGVRRLLKSQFTLGGEASVAAGPVGRQTSANTDLYLSAEILSYSRARGVFAGVSLEGATLRQDLDANEAIYGKPYANKDILEGKVPIPKEANKLIALLNKYSSRK